MYLLDGLLVCFKRCLKCKSDGCYIKIIEIKVSVLIGYIRFIIALTDEGRSFHPEHSFITV